MSRLEMSRLIVRFLNPWKFRREEQRRRLEELRRRDGDNCRRCRRALRFDLPSAHDSAPRIEPILRQPGSGATLDDFVLCHARCNAESGDHTAEVQERLQLRQQQAARPRKRRAAAR